MTDTPFFLSAADAETIHQATLEVLEQTGLRLENKRAEALLRDHGATESNGRICIPAGLVNEALAAAPSHFTVYDRSGAPSLELTNGRNYFGPGSDALYQVDRDSGDVRDSRLRDVGANAFLADAVGYDFVMSMALPQDVGPEALYPATFAEMVKHTTRPIVSTGVSAEDFMRINEIAGIVSDGRNREQPTFLAYLEPLSPLFLDEVGVDKLIYCAENGIPIIFAAGANCGVLAPVSPEGGVVQGGAESLAGLVIAYLVNRDVKFIYGANSASADMRSGFVCYGAAEWARTVAMYADMGRYYNLPSWGTAGCSDAFEIDGQAAWEAYRGIMTALQSCSTLVHDMGYLCFGELYDSRMILLAKEMLDEARQLLQPADLSDEALSVKVINEVATSSSIYLAHPDTARNHRRKLWSSKVINRTKIGQPQEPQREKLARRVAEITAAHDVPSLAPEKQEEIDALLATLS